MIAYIDTHRDRFGVEAICRTLGRTDGGFLTARGYRAAKTRPLSHRAIRDEALIVELCRVHAENYSVYGARKMAVAMRRAGFSIGRDQTSRLMKAVGLHGVQRGKPVHTTIPDSGADARPDMVERRFVADRPNQLWVVDLTYVRTWAGFAYTAFVTDVYSRKIVGWNVAATMSTEDLPLHAFDHAVWAAGTDLSGLVHHSDRGSQYTSIRYTERLTELGVCASVGSRGDSYDNALAEAVNAAYKSELIKPRGPWRTVEQVEFATMEWVWWFNHQRLHEHLGYSTPVEFENRYSSPSDQPRQPVPALVSP